MSVETNVSMLELSTRIHISCSISRSLSHVVDLVAMIVQPLQGPDLFVILPYLLGSSSIHSEPCLQLAKLSSLFTKGREF